MNQIRSVQRLLMIQFFLPIILSLLMVVLFETGALASGNWAGSGQKEFVCSVVMELLTICCIPLSLRLFKYKKVAEALKSDDAQALRALQRWGSVRLDVLGVLLLVNVLFYYLFVHAAFCYMAVIVFLSLFFIYPSLDRCVTETKGDEKV